LLYVKIELFTLTLGDLDVIFEGVSSEEIMKKYFHDYMTSKNDADAQNKFTVLGEEWKKNKQYVSDVVNSFNKNVFENFDLTVLKKDE